MSFCRYLALVLLLAGAVSASDWQHTPPVQADGGRPLELEFTRIDGTEPPRSARLFLELDGQGGPALDAQRATAVELDFQVPVERLAGTRLSYWLELEFTEAQERVPAQGSFSLVLGPTGGSGQGFLLLSAEEAVPGGPVLLAFSLQDETIDPASVELVVDGRPMEGVTTDAWLVTWLGPLDSGSHRIELRAKDRSGKALPAQRFTVDTGSPVAAAAAARPWSAEAFEEFNMQRVDSRPEAWGRHHTGGFRAQGRYGDWRWRSRVLLSGQDFESEILQPQSRYEAEIASKWLEIGLGDRQPQMGNLMLSGTRVRGLDLKLKSRFARLGLVTGATRKALDPLYDGVTAFGGSFQRDLLAVDLGFGDLNTASGALSFMTVRDDLGSIDASQAGVRPTDNLVLGTRFEQKAFKGRLWLRQEAAFSLYNSNITGGVISSDLLADSLGFDAVDPEDLKDFIIVNEYLSPLDLANNPLSSVALDAGMGVRLPGNEFQLEFQRIGPSFVSLGNAFLDTDRQRLRLSDRIRLLESQLFLDLGFGLSTDNLEGQYDAGPGTTSSNELRIGAGWYPRGTDLKVNLAFAQVAEENEALLPKDGLSTSLNQIELGVSKDVAFLGLEHRASLSLQTQDKSDDIGEIAGDTVFDPLKRDLAYGSLQLTLGLASQLDERTRSRVSLGTFSNDYTDRRLGERSWWTLRAGVDREWRPGVLSSGLRFGFQGLGDSRDVVVHNAFVVQEDDYSRMDLGGELQWTPFPRFSVQSRVDMQFYGGERNGQDLDDTDLHFVLRLTQTL
jgi:hypothetical protein